MGNGNNGRMHGPVWKVMDWLMPPALGLLVWMLLQITSMQGDRFTDEDGKIQLHLINQNATTLQVMQAQVAEYQRQNTLWLQHHAQNLDELEAELAEHRKLHINGRE